VRNDAGIIFAPGTRIVLVVLTDSVRDQELAEATISRVATVVLEYFQRRVAA
jgi:hypothetical protein